MEWFFPTKWGKFSHEIRKVGFFFIHLSGYFTKLPVKCGIVFRYL